MPVLNTNGYWRVLNSMNSTTHINWIIVLN
jgi:hypothetical protein